MTHKASTLGGCAKTYFFTQSYYIRKSLPPYPDNLMSHNKNKNSIFLMKYDEFLLTLQSKHINLTGKR